MGNHKIVERIPNDAVPIRNDKNERAFDFKDEGTGIFLYVKCHSNRSKTGDRTKVVKICITDVLKQIEDKMVDSERQMFRQDVLKAINSM